jgi:hypothetical protein
MKARPVTAATLRPTTERQEILKAVVVLRLDHRIVLKLQEDSAFAYHAIRVPDGADETLTTPAHFTCNATQLPEALVQTAHSARFRASPCRAQDRPSARLASGDLLLVSTG